MYVINQHPDRTIIVNGKSYLYFGGTAYLGVQSKVAFQELFIQNIKKYGTNHGASRKANVQLAVYVKAEKKLAELVGSEACISMSSGYLAGQLVSQTLKESNVEFFYAPYSHSALYQNPPAVHADFTVLKQALEKHLKTKPEVHPVLFFDATDASQSGYPDFKILQTLPLKQIILVVDDSHGMGIMGYEGSGAFRNIKKLAPKELIISTSLGKGFGIQAGAIFGNHKRIEKFKKTEFFGGASPAAPAGLATLTEAETIFKTSRNTLKQNIALFKNKLQNSKVFTSIPEHPAFNFSNAKLVAHLEANNILITNFRYPSDSDQIKSRIVISAYHTHDDINMLVKVLNSFTAS